MSFHTRQRLADIPPTAVFRSRNGRLIHQPLMMGVRGMGNIALAPMKNTAPGLPSIPKQDVARTRMKIVENETLRLAPAGPGLPGTFISSAALRDVSGRGSSTTASSGSSLTPSSSALTTNLSRGRALGPGAASIPIDEQPLGRGVMPTADAATMDALRTAAGLPSSTSSGASGFLSSFSFGQVAGAIAGFAVGFSLLVLRTK